MTRQDVHERYHIPLPILEAYERWAPDGENKSVCSAKQYSDADLTQLGTLMTLYDVGFTAEEAIDYLRLLLEQPENSRLRLQMLEKKRAKALDEIHICDRKLARLDYLRHEILKHEATAK